jgi:hypothetical protein
MKYAFVSEEMGNGHPETGAQRCSLLRILFQSFAVSGHIGQTQYPHAFGDAPADLTPDPAVALPAMVETRQCPLEQRDAVTVIHSCLLPETTRPSSAPQPMLSILAYLPFK